MNHESAMQCALGYAWGREDASHTPTYEPAGTTGSYAFALAYAQGWDEYNTDRRGMMTNVRSAYERWQATSGATIWDEYTRPAKPVSLASCGHPRNDDGECDCSWWPERAPIASYNNSQES